MDPQKPTPQEIRERFAADDYDAAQAEEIQELEKQRETNMTTNTLSPEHALSIARQAYDAAPKTEDWVGPVNSVLTDSGYITREDVARWLYSRGGVYGRACVVALKLADVLYLLLRWDNGSWTVEALDSAVPRCGWHQDDSDPRNVVECSDGVVAYYSVDPGACPDEFARTYDFGDSDEPVVCRWIPLDNQEPFYFRFSREDRIARKCLPSEYTTA